MKIIKGTLEELQSIIDRCDEFTGLTRPNTLTEVYGEDTKYVRVDDILTHCNGAYIECKQLLSDYDWFEVTVEELKTFDGENDSV